MRITVVGGTGYAGANIAAEAAGRGHAVTVWSRSAPTETIPGVEYRQGSVLDAAVLEEAVQGADVVVEALSPRGELEGRLAPVVSRLAGLTQTAGAKLAVVGGAGSLLVAEGGPAVADTDGFPDSFRPEAKEMAQILTDLRAWEGPLEWFFLSPAGGFGPWAAGERTGRYRIGGDVLLTDAEGNSNISGADFAIAFVDEIEHPAHTRQRFSVAY